MLLNKCLQRSTVKICVYGVSVLRHRTTIGLIWCSQDQPYFAPLTSDPGSQYSQQQDQGLAYLMLDLLLSGQDLTSTRSQCLTIDYQGHGLLLVSFWSSFNNGNSCRRVTEPIAPPNVMVYFVIAARRVNLESPLAERKRWPQAVANGAIVSFVQSAIHLRAMLSPKVRLQRSPQRHECISWFSHSALLALVLYTYARRLVGIMITSTKFHHITTTT